MKRTRLMMTVMLLFALFIASCARVAKSVGDAPAAEEETPAVEVSGYEFQDFPANAQPATVTADPVKVVDDTLFHAKFEGDAVSGSGGAVGGKYHFIATQTDGESWHVKLEANYPTVAGRDYSVTYRFTSDVSGKVKFGDFQEFEIKEGENTVTGIFTAKDSTSYLDLQLGMLQPFTIDFTEIEVKEYADEVEYENALPAPVNFLRESRVYERHDSGYETVLVRGKNAININCEAIPMDTGVWKSRLYVRTGVVPEPGVHYRVTADVMCDHYDRPIKFEVLINDGEVEKGYGALYDQSMNPGEVKTCEAVITGNGNGDELILQFSLGEMRAGALIIVGNVHVDKVIDHYTNALADDFALDTSTATGAMIEELVPVSYTNIPISPSFYSGVDTVYEQHDDGYIVNLTENASSATMAIVQAPANAADRGVWKAKLYAATGVSLEPNTSYRIQFDLDSTCNQADYDVCFDGATENAYGALYGRSLTAGGTDHIDMLVTPTANNGPLTIRLQLGKTDTASGNTVTLKNLSVESVKLQYTDVPLDNCPPYTTGLNVWEGHDDGYDTEVSADGTSATLAIKSAPESDRGVWKSKLYIDTGVTPEAGTKYVVRFDVESEKDQAKYEVCFDGNEENKYGALYEQKLTAGETQTVSYSFTPEEVGGPIVLRFQLGETDDATGNTVKVSNLKVATLTPGGDWTEVELKGLEYPTVSSDSTEPREAGYYPVELPALSELSSWEAHDNGFTQSVNGASLHIESVPTADPWNSKLFVNVPLEEGAKYRLTAKVSSSAAIPFYELHIGHDGDELAYGVFYERSISAGGTDTFVSEFDATTGYATMQFLLGKSPAGTTFSVTEAVLEKWNPESEKYETVELPPLSELASWEAHDNGFTQSVNGTSLNIESVPILADPWNSKLFVNVPLEEGEKYKLSVEVSSDAAISLYEFHIGHDGNEKAYGEFYGQSIAAGGSNTHATGEFTATTGYATLQFQLGKSPAGTTFSVTKITLEKWEDAVTPGETLDPGSFKLWSFDGYSTALGGDGSSATARFDAVPDDGEVWKTKLFADTGLELEAGKTYRVSADVQATQEFDYEICYNNGETEKGAGNDGNAALYGCHATSTAQTQTYEVTADSNAHLIIQFSIGNAPAGTVVTVSNIKVEEQADTEGENLMKDPLVAWAPIHAFVHEDYEAHLTNTDSSASAVITKVPSSDREPWKIKLFAETGAELKAGKTYRVSVDVQATGTMQYDICYNDKEAEAALGAKYGLMASTSKGTVTYTVTPDADAELLLQFNLGGASGPTTFTISNVKVEEVSYASSKDVIPNFSYDSVGYISKASDDGYITSLEQGNSSATFDIIKAPTERHAWNAKVIVRTGITPKPGVGYRISFNVNAAKPQNLFEVFYNGNEELAYGAQYEQYLAAGNNSFSYTIMPGDSKGELVLHLRFGETNGTDGNTYTISNFKFEEVAFVNTVRPEIKDVVENVTQDGYSAQLTKTPDSAMLRLVQTPSEGLEAWKNKLFVNTGVTLEPGQKYRVFFNVRSIIPAPFEVCFNNGDVEKGLGAIFGLTSDPAGTYIEYTTYVNEPTRLAIQLSLGNCTTPNTFFLSDVRVEQAGKIDLVSDTIYTF